MVGEGGSSQEPMVVLKVVQGGCEGSYGLTIQVCAVRAVLGASIRPGPCEGSWPSEGILTPTMTLTPTVTLVPTANATLTLVLPATTTLVPALAIASSSIPGDMASGKSGSNFSDTMTPFGASALSPAMGRCWLGSMPIRVTARYGTRHQLR